jgi:hypothetical protein
MAPNEVVTAVNSDRTLLGLAREIAIDLNPLETILKNYQVTLEQWSLIQTNPHFLRLLNSEIEAWNAAANTHDRVRLKSAAMFEEWLPEAFKLLHDTTQGMPARTELAKLVARVAGIGERASDGPTGEKFTFTLNIGGATQLRFEKDAPLTIDAVDTAQ